MQNLHRLQSLLLTALVCAGAAPSPGATQTSTPPAVITLPAGTRLPIRLAQSLDTGRDKPGASFVAHLTAPVVHQNQVVLERGAVCRGHLVESKPSGRLKGRAVLRLSLDSIESHGNVYAIATSGSTFVGKGHKSRNLALVGGGTGTGATIGAIAGGGVGAAIGAGAGAVAGTSGALITGKRNLHLAAETRLNFALRRPLAVRVPAQPAQRFPAPRG